MNSTPRVSYQVKKRADAGEKSSHDASSHCSKGASDDGGNNMLNTSHVQSSCAEGNSFAFELLHPWRPVKKCSPIF